jgi:hypothetical protein
MQLSIDERLLVPSGCVLLSMNGTLVVGAKVVKEGVNVEGAGLHALMSPQVLVQVDHRSIWLPSVVKMTLDSPTHSILPLTGSG